jgi:hypothetical protein
MICLNDPAVVAAEYASGWGELAARLRDATGAAVVAVDISPRMVELARSSGVDAHVGDGPSPSTFTRENGEEILRRHFAKVHREDVDGTVEFATRAAVVDYVSASIAMSPFVDNVPHEVPEPFRARRALSLFVADKPR